MTDQDKLQYYQFLSEKAALRIVSNISTWKDFLRLTGRLYKYPYHDQLMIYAQRPDATAVAPIDIWNKRMYRGIQQGSHGIALLPETTGKLRYIFDVADTYPRRQDSRLPQPWQVGPYEEAVIANLSTAFGISDVSPLPLSDGLYAAAKAATEQTLGDFLEDLQEKKENSFLEELDEINLRQRLRQTATQSTAYAVLSRFGLDADEYITDEDFPYLTDFSTPATVNILGCYVSLASDKILRSTEQVLKHTERRNEHDNRGRARHDLSSGRGRDDSRPGRSLGGITAGGPLRQDVGGEYEEAASRDLQQPDFGGETQHPGAGDRPDGQRADRAHRKVDGGEGWDERGAEGPGSNALGGTDEQLQAQRGGDRAERADQLTFFSGAVTEYAKEAESEQLSASSIPWKEIDAELRKGTGTGGGKRRIYDLYRHHPERKVAVDFLKKEYGWYGHSHTYADGSSGFVDYQPSSGMKLRHYGSDAQDFQLSWNAMEQRVRLLISEGTYLTGEERSWLQERDEDTQNAEDSFEDVDPSAIREHLRQAGIENGQVVDPEALNKDPFIRTVMADAAQVTQKAQPAAAPAIRFPEVAAVNFRIADERLGAVGPKAKYTCNAEAIKTLQVIEREGRRALVGEQEILSRYVGWGGIPQAFETTNSSWAGEARELKTLLSPEEYESAKESTLTAFYTSPVVIRAMYQALEQLGFRQGNIIDPGCGIGNFMGMLPESMSGSRFYGVELDSITGRIAQLLYPNNRITIQGFESADFPDSFFDCAIGNVPFGQYKVLDKRYDKYNFLIHDYFFSKALDKVRPGGLVLFITSKGTMDKENPSVRRYLAQRAELLGAIRLPNNAFRSNAGTEVTSDILFLQKRDRMTVEEPDWVHLDFDTNGIKMNRYFIDHPEMILGEMVMESTQYGPDSTCKPIVGVELSTQLQAAIANIHGQITEAAEISPEETEDRSLPADPAVRNFSYTLVDDQLYYRENSRMKPVSVSATAESRVKGMIAIRDCVRTLIEYQTEDYSDEAIQKEQQRLNSLYDVYTRKYGLLSSRGNKLAFSDDSSYCLLCSLEVLDEDGKLERKADMFNKRTIRQRTVITSVDTAAEALAVSLTEKAGVDMAFMSQLTGKTEEQIKQDLTGVIFRFPGLTTDAPPRFVPADEYLSGNVREKLEQARLAAAANSMYAPNVKALEAVQPPPLTASEISVRLGAAWLPVDVPQDFIFFLLTPGKNAAKNITVRYSPYTTSWTVEGKNSDDGNIKANSTYGTKRINAYKIIEETLNLRDARVYDYIKDADGNRKPVLNKKETTIAQQKEELIKTAFTEWIWQDQPRRERLCKLYNETFNSTRPRQYDGSHLQFPGMNPEIVLRPHQVNAIAHILYGGNTLLAHVVGAGKTYEMVAAAMENKRLGLCQKSLFVVPNHLTEQWASEFLQLYPAANILVATRKDFETQNRKKFCGRIATGDYDAIIIGHSQFEKIPLSFERQKQSLDRQIDEITLGIADAKSSRAENFTIKQMAKTKKGLEVKLKKLNDQSRKDDLITFEELGVDRLFVDEAHYYKNMFLFTKMRNVAGIAQTEAQKSSDLFMKCEYLDDLTDAHGVVFATGTPISNSMVELFTMQRYLQYGLLKQHGLQNFDSWASTFGETVTATELSPDGKSFRAKTRFARFYNLPELMSMFREVADIQTADMLDLPVPKVNYQTVVIQPSEQQEALVESLSERADQVRNRMVDATQDNMLLITNDGRKLALDQRLYNPTLPDDENGKVSACAQKVYERWEKYQEQRLTQLVFCDLSTPKNDGQFSVYNDLRKKLIAKGIPENEIAFIHDAKTEAAKQELFIKVRTGKVRVLMGSTAKMGAGTNVQDRLIASHDLDCPWRPSDLEQRAGRIVRQGNRNPEVEILRYVTERTFDAYLYQLVESKQRFISQIMTSKSPVRSAEDIDEAALSYAEIKALATGNPLIKEKMDVDIEVARLKVLKSSYLSQKYALEDQITKLYPAKIADCEFRIRGFHADIAQAAAQTIPNADGFSPMVIAGKVYSDKELAGKAILVACQQMNSPAPVKLGSYRGFTTELSFDEFSKSFTLHLKNTLRYRVALGDDVFGNITRLNNAVESLPKMLRDAEENLEDLRNQLKNARDETRKPFAQETELKLKSGRLAMLNARLNLDEREVVSEAAELDDQNEEMEL